MYSNGTWLGRHWALFDWRQSIPCNRLCRDCLLGILAVMLAKR